MKYYPIIILKTAQILLFINIAFWAILSLSFIYSSYGVSAHIIIKILLIFEPIAYAIALYGILKSNKLIYLFALLLAFGNTILSITDELNLSDIISLILSLTTFAVLLLLWKSFFSSKKSQDGS